MKARAEHQMKGLDKNLNQANILRGPSDDIPIPASIFQGSAGHVSSSFWYLDREWTLHYILEWGLPLSLSMK